MGFSNIEKKDWLYKLFHNYVIFIHNKIFYRKVYVLNADKIPKNAHVIFTPNHQNALMDALGPLCNIDKQLVFLARSDIFKKKAVASILYFLKILPIFRIRDGYSEIKKNTGIFQKTIDVINAKNGLVILPEGNHEGVHYLRQLKKGFARIAFQTEEASGFSLDIKIVPVGIHYTDYIKSRSDLYLNFGDPISVSDYYDLYKESPAKAINKITSDLAEEIKPLMVNIENNENYKLYVSLKDYYWDQMPVIKGDIKNKKANRLEAEQDIISVAQETEVQSPEDFEKLKNLTNTYTREINKYGFRNDLFCKPVSLISLLFQSIGFVIGLPLLIYGLLVNIFPLGIVKYMENKIKDPQFKSSFKFVLAIFIFPIFYLIQSILIIIFCQSFWIGLILIISMPVSGAIAYFYISSFKRFRSKFNIWLFKQRKASVYDGIMSTKRAIDSIITNSASKYLTGNK